MAINNTLPTKNNFLSNYGTGNSFLNGVLKPPATSSPVPNTPNMSTVNGPKYAPPSTTGLLSTPATPKPATPLVAAPIQKAPVSNTTATPTPPLGGSAPTSFSGGAVLPQDPNGAYASIQTPQQNQSVQGLFPSVVSSLANRGTQPSQAYTDAMNNYQGYNRQLQQSLSNEGTAIAQNGVDRIPVGEQSGLDAVIRNQYLQQQQSIAAGAQGASNALGAANTQQANQQSALNQAAGYAQPQLGSIGQVPFNPTDLSQGSPLGAPGGTAADAAKVAGQFQGAQAAAAAPGQAQASNIQTGGTAATNSYAGIYNTANTNAANYSQQQSAINAVGNQALSLLNSIPGRSSSQFVNARLNQLATQFSSPEYAAFNTAIQSLQARIGQALQAGEIPTAATGNAQSIANGDITVGGLASTLQQVDKEMGAFVQTQNDLANYAKSQLGNGGTTSTGGSSSGSTSGFAWNGN